MSSREDIQQPLVAIVGTGAVGSSLAMSLAARDYALCLVSRRLASASRLAERLAQPATVQTTTLDHAELADARVVFVCVPDDEISSVAHTLSVEATQWNDVVVAHTSGIHTSQVLHPLQQRGAFTAAFHPVQSFAGIPTTDDFNQIVVTLEGDNLALTRLESIVRSLDSRPLRVRADQKEALHASAAIASNYLVTLVDLAVDVGLASGLAAKDITDVLTPLIRRTADNVASNGPAMSLTGPISRGDVTTVERHVEMLARFSNEIVTLYRLLGRRTADIAHAAGHITDEQRIRIRRALQSR